VTKHAVLGASSSDRWMNCPASVRLSEDLPDSTSSYATEGTAAHSLAERALRKGLDADVWLDSYIDAKGEKVLVDEEMIEAVQTYINHIRKKVQAAGEGARHLLEVRFDLSPLNPPGPMFGTADSVLWQPEINLLDIDDYKHGAGVVVDAWENSQLMYYALGAVLELNIKPNKIRVTIVQPRGIHPDGIVRVYEFGWRELVAFKRRLFTRAIETQAPNAEIKMGGWCKFCKALPVCPAHKGNALVVAQEEFADMPARMPPSPERLTQDEILLVLEKMDLVQDWFRSIRVFVQEGLERGEEMPGWKLVERRAVRKWVSESEAVEWFLAQGFEHADAYTKKVISPAQMEKRVKATLPRGQKKEAAESLELLTEKKSSGYNLAPATDPRPAISGSAADDFDVLPAQNVNAPKSANKEE